MAKTETGRVWIRRWLILIAVMVYAMILIGGMTRLTDSGLSITEWDPISGALPPIGHEAWLAEFDKYKQTAEFQQQNYNMTLGEFEYIYWWEWGHRLFGRLIGLVAIGGFIVFAARKWMGRNLSLRLLVLIALGGLQGAIGWWMVSSGIGETDRLDVAPYRLMTHFVLALIIIGYTAWLWLDLGRRSAVQVKPLLRKFAIILAILITVQMASGALVAGLDAGRTYTDWPLMNGEFVPSNYVETQLGVRSLFEGRAATQFNHRILAYIIWALAMASAWLSWRTAARSQFVWLGGLVTLQAVWGIGTLLSGAPLQLAIVHQALGVIVFVAAIRLMWISRTPTELRSPSS
ncbi:COX15/CtaA family protein [Henriciella litoralis]|uniref:COX15/CtaA family protein n=1 Tax=Henriciella litoralis TaxID=568102 RepID=UPI000A07A228|nr:COX15/CtaA family protein [Henriciella litoralis]